MPKYLEIWQCSIKQVNRVSSFLFQSTLHAFGHLNRISNNVKMNFQYEISVMALEL
jgi:hypothetical protein